MAQKQKRQPKRRWRSKTDAWYYSENIIHQAQPLVKEKQEGALQRWTYTLFMVFTKRLREGIRRGEITCSVRIWMSPRVRVGARYRMEEGEIEVDSIEPIGFPDITPELARESGFLGVLDLLKVAKHGRGENIYLIRFHYVRPRAKRMGRRKSG
ncbi:MAG: ASCH domain-containing protein [Candidatus Acidiferrales bacterium]